MSNKNFNFSKETIDEYGFDLEPFFEKIKILESIEKASPKALQFEQDAAFLKALKPLLGDKLQAKTAEAIKMLPFFSIVPVLKKTKAI